MLKTTAFIGFGFVGKACHKVFEDNTEAIVIDPLYSDITIADLPKFDCKLTFVSIFAPTLDDGSVDASDIYNIFQQLADIGYAGLVVLKSTLPPDIVDDLYIKFGSDSVLDKAGPLRYIYSPEFIRQESWEKDALDPKFIIIAGNFHDCEELKILYKKHSAIPSWTRFIHVDYREASLAKYAINTLLATKVAFMNQLYQLHIDMYGMNQAPHSDSWDSFIGILSSDTRIGSSHLQVPGPDGQFGYGGACFPKDVKALIGYDKNNRMTILREAAEANTAIRLTGAGKSDTI